LKTTTEWSVDSRNTVNNQLSDLRHLDNCSDHSKPLARIQQSHYGASIGTKVLFKDISDFGETRRWAYGEQFSSDPKLESIYNSIGDHTITLQAENSLGRSSASTFVRVLPEPLSACLPSVTATSIGINEISIGDQKYSSPLITVSKSYEDYCEINTFNVYPDIEYDMRISIAGTKYLTVVFDSDQDGILNSDSELIGSFYTSRDGKYRIPWILPRELSSNSLFRLRIIASTERIDDYCQITEGQVQDHSVYVIQEMEYGCTDINATNFDSQATIDDGSCQYERQVLSYEHVPKLEYDYNLDNSRSLFWSGTVDNFNYQYTLETSDDLSSGFSQLAYYPDPRIAPYTYIDYEEFVGVRYYRLGLVHLNTGSTSYGDVISVVSKNEKVSCFPNPANDFITINSRDILPEQLSVFLMDGRQSIINLERRTRDQYTYNISNLNSGLYYLSSQSKQQTFYLKFIVVK